MQGTEWQRFRTSTTRGEPIAEPEIAWPSAVELVEPEVLVFDFRVGEPRRRLPHEAYLRQLLAADPDDSASLTALCGSLGEITLSPGAFVKLTDDPLLGLTGFRQKVDAWSATQHDAIGRGLAEPIVENGGPVARSVFALDSVRFSVKLLQSMVRHWLAVSEQVDPSDAWRTWFPEVGKKDVSDRCWFVFETALNESLRPFAPAVRISGYTPRFQTHAAVGATASTAEALALQLYNAILEALPVRRCPECGTRFVRQEGRAAHDQHRTTSVTYCSRRCARLKADRDYKARKRAEKGK